MNETLPQIPLATWNRLGSKSFWLFFSQKSETALCFAILAVIFSVARAVPVLPKEIVPYLGLAGTVCFAIFVVALIVALIASRLAYTSFEFCLADDALKIRQGIFNQHEVAIPYRQIQTVNMERTLSERLMKLERLIVVTGAEDDPDTKVDESEWAMPAMDESMAQAFQEELLKRVDVQKVVAVDKNKIGYPINE